MLTMPLMFTSVASATSDVTITANPATHDTIVGCGFTFTANPTGEWGSNIQYSWLCNNDNSNPDCPADWTKTGKSISCTAACTGTHVLSVVATDELGHSASTSYPITVHDEYEIQSSSTDPAYYPEGFPDHTAYYYVGTTPTRTESVCYTRSNSVNVGISGGVGFLEGHFGVTHGESVTQCTATGCEGHEIPCGKRGRLFFGPEFEKTTGTLRKWSCGGSYTDDDFTVLDFTGTSYKQIDEYYCGSHSSQTQSCSCEEGYSDCNSDCTGGDQDGCECSGECCGAGTPNAGTCYTPKPEEGCCKYGEHCKDLTDAGVCTTCYSGSWNKGWHCEGGECVPEASTFVLLATGLLFLVGYIGLRRKEN